MYVPFTSFVLKFEEVYFSLTSLLIKYFRVKKGRREKVKSRLEHIYLARLLYFSTSVNFATYQSDSEINQSANLHIRDALAQYCVSLLFKLQNASQNKGGSE